MDVGPCFGTREHPRRDTDMILRPSKSRIEDLSFYIGFTRIGSKIKDLGPCFGMNGHPRRDMDVISRLSKSTIQDLSFYIGFTRIRSRIKDLIKDLGSWTLFWHEWASSKGYGRDIKTVQVYNPRSIILYRFYKDRIK